jgi:hypothetical protein
MGSHAEYNSALFWVTCPEDSAAPCCMGTPLTLLHFFFFFFYNKVSLCRYRICLASAYGSHLVHSRLASKLWSFNFTLPSTGIAGMSHYACLVFHTSFQICLYLLFVSCILYTAGSSSSSGCCAYTKPLPHVTQLNDGLLTWSSKY